MVLLSLSLFGITPHIFPNQETLSLLPFPSLTPKPHGRLCQRTSSFWEDWIWVFSFSLVFPFISISSLFCFDDRCNHYRRRCRIRAPCCNEIYSCRHCHNEAAVFLSFSFIFTSNYLPFCFYLIWVGLVFPIRACWRIPLIATSSFAKMLNKYDNHCFSFFFSNISIHVSDELGLMSETNALFTSFCRFRLFVQFVTLSNLYVFFFRF